MCNCGIFLYFLLQLYCDFKNIKLRRAEIIQTSVNVQVTYTLSITFIYCTIQQIYKYNIYVLPSQPQVQAISLAKDKDVEDDPEEGEDRAQTTQHQAEQLECPPMNTCLSYSNYSLLDTVLRSRSRSRWSLNYLGPGAGAGDEIKF